MKAMQTTMLPMNLSPDDIRMLSEEHAQRAVDIRRHLCQWPEISGQEEKTSALVVSVLKQLGIPVKEKVGGFGVVGLIEGNGPGPTIAFRADMDALPLQMAKLPMEFKSLGMSIHNDMDEIAKAAEGGTPPPEILKMTRIP